ncbi:MAG: hypothetical protein SFU56_05800 [Capsulimonadales bacterium]|nr:hypothetical protein [Capsulimonadales bacterium]
MPSAIRTLVPVAVLLLGPFAVPGRPQGVEKEVRFRRGEKSVVLTGRIPKTAFDYDAYVMRARAGQRLSVRLTASDKAAGLRIYSLERGPIDDQIAPTRTTGDLPRDWSGKLPESGRYSIQVYGKRQGTSYKLRVAVE